LHMLMKGKVRRLDDRDSAGQVKFVRSSSVLLLKDWSY